MKFVSAALLAGLICLSNAALAGPPQGTWLSEDGGTKVHIASCGGKLCGSVVWLKEPTDRETGKAKTDKLNPDPTKRSRPMIGLQVVQGLTPDRPDTWSGRIYNADDGKTYQASMKVPDTGKAQVKGCVLGILCKTQTWTRAN